MLTPSVVVHYFDVDGSDARPYKANAPLVVDANAVLPLSVTLQRLKTIPRRRFQEVQRLGDLQLSQLALCNCQNSLLNFLGCLPSYSACVNLHLNDWIMHQGYYVRRNKVQESYSADESRAIHIHRRRANCFEKSQHRDLKRISALSCGKQSWSVHYYSRRGRSPRMIGVWIDFKRILKCH